MNTAKTSITAILMTTVIMAALTAPFSAHAACDNCPKRFVMLYDFDVQVQQPGDPAQFLNWQKLFWAARSVATVAVNDPTAPCLVFLDGTIVGQDGSISDSAQFGINHAHLAPAGAGSGADYLITGTVTGSEGAYSLSISLETVCSRERVATGTTSFSNASQALATGTTLGSQVLSNLAATIQHFEENKRNANADVARYVSDDHIVITHSKPKATRAESIPVKITLADCDGVPLAGKTLTLKASQFHGLLLNGSENGAFTAQTITTDASGTATPNFLTGATPGIAVLRVYFIYKSPAECEKVAGANATILIEDPIRNAYVVKVNYSESVSRIRKWSGDVGTYHRGKDKYESTISNNMTMTAICENTAVSEGRVDLVSSHVAIQGSKYDRTETRSHLWGQVPPLPFGETIDYSLYTMDGIVTPGNNTDGMSGVTFTYDSKNPVSNSLEFFAALIEQTRNYEWHYTTPSEPGDVAISSYRSDTVTTESLAISRTVPWYDKGTFRVVDSGFAVTLYHDSTYNEIHSASEPMVNHTIISIQATIRPLSEFLRTTVIKNQKGTASRGSDIFKLSFSGQQNRAGTIGFSLNHAEKVTIALYNMSGIKMTMLAGSVFGAGSHRIEWDTRDLPAGCYTVTMQAGLNRSVRRVAIVR